MFTSLDRVNEALPWPRIVQKLQIAVLGSKAQQVATVVSWSEEHRKCESSSDQKPAFFQFIY